jgi:hypothetical protein
LYQFHPATLSQSGIVRVRLEPVAFAGWSQLTGKRGAMLNANALQFLRTPSGASRLLVLCRDRELIFVMDPDTGQLIGQTTLKLLSPEGQTIEWVSPEGIAYEPGSGIIYVISDPDSTDGNYRLRSTSSAQGRFAQFVPLLFQFKVPDELLR